MKQTITLNMDEVGAILAAHFEAQGWRVPQVTWRLTSTVQTAFVAVDGVDCEVEPIEKPKKKRGKR